MPVIRRTNHEYLIYYPDNWYVLGVIHDLGILWKQRGFLISPGTLIKNGQQVNDLSASLLPSEIAVIEIEADTKRTKCEYQRSTLADLHAKATAPESIKIVAHVVLCPFCFCKKWSFLCQIFVILMSLSHATVCS